MAYIDFALHEAAASIPPLYLQQPLSALERKAVMLGRLDPLSSLHDQGFRQKLRDLLLGPDRTNPLADPRLEALRRFAVAVAHQRDDMIGREQARLSALGFTNSQTGEARALTLSWHASLS